jgi:hypothetical protein
MFNLQHNVRDVSFTQAYTAGTLAVAQTSFHWRRPYSLRIVAKPHPMFVIRPFAIVPDGLHGGKVARIRLQPCTRVFGLDRDDAAVVASRDNFGRRLGRDYRPST